MAVIFPHATRINFLTRTALWRRALARAVGRIADSAVEQSVVRAAPTTVRRGFGKPQARWYTVQGSDGRPHLVAEWRRRD